MDVGLLGPGLQRSGLPPKVSQCNIFQTHFLLGC